MSNKNKRLYNSIRFNSVLGNIIISFLFVIFIIVVFVVASSFFVQYAIENKFAEEYDRITTIAKMYEEGKDSKDIKRILDASNTSFIVKDSKDKVIYQNGENTCSDERAVVKLENAENEFVVYKDTKAGYLYPKEDGTLGFKTNEFIKKLNELYNDEGIHFSLSQEEEHSLNLNTGEMEEEGVVVSYNANEGAMDAIEDIKIPIWVSTELEDGSHFIGKALLSVNVRDLLLIVKIIIGVLGFLVLYIIVMAFVIGFSAVNRQRIKWLFYKDMVIDAYNWMWFVVYGNKIIRKGANSKNNYAVVSLEFKNYRNYCLCHSISDGDKLLSKINVEITNHLMSKEICAHATTSNFALLLKYDDVDKLKERLQDLMKALNDIVPNHEFTFHTGVALLNSIYFDTLSKNSNLNSNGSKTNSSKSNDSKIDKERQNQAAKVSKLARKNLNIENIYNNACAAKASLADTDGLNIRIFDQKLMDEQHWNDIVHEKQWDALEQEQFQVYYQPKYDPKTNELRGAEALIRWLSPEFGLVSPGRIIPIFEKNGFITEIDHYMIEHVAKDQKRWYDQGYKCVPVSVNVSRAHFIESDLAEQIRDIIDRAGCPHDLIEIELTESAFFDDKNALVETIKRLKSYGFSVSMDDFGAGYSSLNSLKDMPLDVLKLDADFFRGENAGKRGDIVVEEAIKLAKRLEMRTVAEGVEEKEQVDLLVKLDCDMIQGYYYAKPMPKNEYEQRMTLNK